MERQTILISGATGNLGGRMAQELRKRGALVRAIVRPGTSPDRLNKLREQRVEIIEADLYNKAAVVRACDSVVCVVSTLLGLAPILIDAQGALLDAAVEAGVPRFIPSDYAMDFTKFHPRLNRNFDLHRQFRARLEAAPLRSTAILNGAFMNLLTGEAPLVLLKIKRVLYWGQNPEQKIDFTTNGRHRGLIPPRLRLTQARPASCAWAGEQISAAGLARAASEVGGKNFRLFTWRQSRQIARDHQGYKGAYTEVRCAVPHLARHAVSVLHVRRQRDVAAARQRALPESAMDGCAHGAQAGFLADVADERRQRCQWC